MDESSIADFSNETEKVLDYLHGEFAKLQTGQANAALVEHIEVEAYGQRQPLKTIAGISIESGRTIVVQPWDKSIMQDVEKALTEADLGATPASDGVVLRIALPPMTEERRKQLTKLVHDLAEEARISVRQQRQKLNDKIKEEEKDEDRRYTLLEKLDKSVKEANEKIEGSMKKKEQEVMTV